MAERMTYDVVLVGGSPSNLALAHRLVDLATASGVSFSLAILEKAKEFGGHIVSGAVVKPDVLQRLFPNHQAEGFPIEGICTQSHFTVLGHKNAWNVPNALLPDGLQKQGYWILSLSLVVAWMANQLKAKTKDHPNVVVDLFPGFSAHEVLYEGQRVIGVSVVERLANSPNPHDNALYGKLVVFGDKGFISGGVIDRFELRDNPQIWSVGVKEVWSLPEGRQFDNAVWHTLGYPLTDGSFGGGFIYGLKNNRLAVGFIASLDSPNPNLNPQQLLQQFKKHPMLQAMLKNAKLQKYGAALLPEGGYYSLPRQFAVDGALLVGDALGVLDVSSLNGVANSVETGMIAAEVIHAVLQECDDFTADRLSRYRDKVLTSSVGESLMQGRYFRDAWSENPRLLGRYLPEVLKAVDEHRPWVGLMNAGLKHNPVLAVMDATRLKLKMDGLLDFGRAWYRPDHEHLSPDYKAVKTEGMPDLDIAVYPETVYSREDAVFYAAPRYHHGNEHIDEFSANVCTTCINHYESRGLEVPCVADCTAEVHRVDTRTDVASAGPVAIRVHGMSLENCIQCRTCEIVCPEQNLKVRPTMQGAGPDFLGL